MSDGIAGTIRDCLVSRADPYAGPGSFHILSTELEAEFPGEVDRK